MSSIRIPMLKSDSLKGALIYYDGTFNDARMNLTIVLTAIRHGAKEFGFCETPRTPSRKEQKVIDSFSSVLRDAVYDNLIINCEEESRVEKDDSDPSGCVLTYVLQCANHVKVQRLLKDGQGKICGAHVKDMISGNEWDIKAKAVVNATGPSTDTMRLMADPMATPICTPSSGVHIVLPGYYCPTKTGLLDPDTSDGRVLFLLPWERMTIAGTTDAPSEVTLSPAPKNSDVEFILQEVRSYLSKTVPVRRGDVTSAWSGLRPLVRDPNKKDTKSLARNHIIEISKSGLITIAGGKWTTYRHMAEETVDACVKAHHLKPTNGCVTAGLVLEGGHEYNPLMYIRLVQDYGLDVDVSPT
ncbi:FAD dependent oxidoreductase [Ancylostoma ceylanicum]|uniref:glycerol-3-phosphate dehydrogenase n=1 Tax=Ancylostoma ceylanicum TaxID=53326 RepID=A0A0D6LZU2_9BILA|nr:FAD dependent oxidoreductase [Ancylostoma ceylanicum]